MRISEFRTPELDLRERPEARAARGEDTFSVDGARGAEAPADNEQGVLYAGGSGAGRRRVVNRSARRTDVHGKHALHEETHRATREAGFSLDRHGDEGAEAGEG